MIINTKNITILKLSIYLLIVSLYLQPVYSMAQAPQGSPPSISKKEKQAAVEAISKLLNKQYVFPEVAKKMGQHISDKSKQGAYKSIKNPREFSETLTADLQSVSQDKHIRVMFAPNEIKERKQAVSPADSIALKQQEVEMYRQQNFGFKEVKILEGNIGYLNLTSFEETEFAGETAAAAMNFLGNTEALIIDLRSNGGGSPTMIQLLTSYLYNAEPVHLNNFYWRPTGSTTQTWTLPYVPGKRRPDVPVYVLTSNRTFSAAEEFSYNLQQLKRATLIGETTGGGAHPGGVEIANEQFAIFVPSGKAINPISNKNWEGTGVQPHVQVKQADALATAHIKILENLANTTSNPQLKSRYNWQLMDIKAQQKPVTLDAKTLQTYAGSFGVRHLKFKDGKLFYEKEGRPAAELKAMEKDLFSVVGHPYFRIKMVLDNKQPTAIKMLLDNGDVQEHKKTK